MPDRPDQPDPPDEWRVYQGDSTPDPEPPLSTSPPTVGEVPYGQAGPHVPYGMAGTAGTSSFEPVFVSTTRSGASKIALLVVALSVLGGAVAAAIAIFASVDGGIGGLGGIDAKDPADVAALAEELEEFKGTTEVQSVGFYTDYVIVYLPFTSNPQDDGQISFTWKGGDKFDEWTRSTSDQPTFDLASIDTGVIAGMCDDVLRRAEGATPDDCYIHLSKPGEGSKAWFRAFATDSFGRSVWAEFDKDGVLVGESE